MSSLAEYQHKYRFIHLSRSDDGVLTAVIRSETLQGAGDSTFLDSFGSRAMAIFAIIGVAKWGFLFVTTLSRL